MCRPRVICPAVWMVEAVKHVTSPLYKPEMLERATLGFTAVCPANRYAHHERW